MNDDFKQGVAHLWDIATVPLLYGMVWLIAILLGNQPPTAKAPLLMVKVWPWPLWLRASLFASLFFAAMWILFNPLRDMANDAYGGARKAVEREIKKMGLRAATGLILGVLGGRFIRTDEPLSVLVIAPPNSGKTMALIVPCLLSCGNSMIAHDPKGELYVLTAPHRATFSKVYRFAPGEDVSASWNLFSKRELPKRWEDIEVHVDRAANALLPDPEKGDKTWARGGREIFIFWALANIILYGETSFAQILENAYLTDDAIIREDEDEKIGTQGLIADVLDSNPNLPKRVRLIGKSLTETPYRQFQGYAGEFRGALNVFLDPRVAANTSRSDFSLTDLRRERTTVYLCIQNVDQTRLRPFISLFCEMAALETIKRPLNEGEFKTTIMLDEMMRLNRLQELANMPAISRGYGGNAVFVFQSMSQAEGLYGREGVKTFKNTCSYRVVFAPNDHTDAKEISDDIGPKTRRRRSESSGGRGIFRSISDSLEAAPLYSPQDLMNLRDGKILILAQNWFKRPVECKASFWFNDPAMRSLISSGQVEEARSVVKSNTGMVTESPDREEPGVTIPLVTNPTHRDPAPVTMPTTAPAPVEEEEGSASSDLAALVTDSEDPDTLSVTMPVCDTCGRLADFDNQLGQPCLDVKEEKGTEFCAGTFVVIKENADVVSATA